MASIVELRDKDNEELEEMLENDREEMFNLRFQLASARLEDVSRVRFVRREIAQLETVLRMRELAIDRALDMAEVNKAIEDTNWQATARFVYEDSAWLVEFADDNDDEVYSTLVDLNKKRMKGRKTR
jgi:large subunit ribosomal protein L29